MLTGCHARVAEDQPLAGHNLLVGDEDQVGERIDINLLDGNESVHILLLEVDDGSRKYK